jgi:hypothetical protein
MTEDDSAFTQVYHFSKVTKHKPWHCEWAGVQVLTNFLKQCGSVDTIA